MSAPALIPESHADDPPQRGRRLIWSVCAWSTLLLAIVSAVGFNWPYRDRGRSLTLPGTVEIQEVRLSSKVGGRVAEVFVDEGDRVEAGQPVVRFDAPELEARRDRLRADVAGAKAMLEKARHGPRPEEIAQARAALAVAEAQLKLIEAGSRQEDIDQARAELDSHLLDLRRAEEDLARWKKLVAEGVAVQGQLEIRMADHGRLEGQVRAARARVYRLEAGARREEILEVKARVEQSRAALNLLLAGTRQEDIALAEAQVASLEAQLADLQTQLNETTVRAVEPVHIEVVAVRPGEIVAPNQPVVRVLRDGDLWVKAYVPETELGRVHEGQAVSVTIDSHRGERFAGKVTFIANVSEFTPRNVQSISERRHQVFGIKVRVTAAPGIFKPGMAADVIVPLNGGPH
jgi:multidrug resistance efflux pump